MYYSPTILCCDGTETDSDAIIVYDTQIVYFCLNDVLCVFFDYLFLSMLTFVHCTLMLYYVIHLWVFYCYAYGCVFFSDLVDVTKYFLSPKFWFKKGRM
jgi:hypothetical protein